MEFFRIKGYNTEKYFALYPTMPQVFFRCIPQWKRFSSVVGYNGIGLRFSSVVGYNGRGFPLFGTQWRRFSAIVGYNGEGFPLLLDTMEEVFLHCGIQQKRFLSIVGYNQWWAAIIKNLSVKAMR
jgi:hypothetical protein